MLISTKGILIHQVRYSEKSLVLKVLTSEEGIRSFFLHSATGKKNKGQGALQPLNLLEIVYRKDDTRDLQTIREFRLEHPYTHIGFDFLRNTVILFLGEVLYKSLREAGPQNETYEYIRSWLITFDQSEWDPSAHLFFLAGLTGRLGFLPEDNYSESRPHFDMIDGSFKSTLPNHTHFISPPISLAFISLFHKGIFQSAYRKEILTLMLEYYRLHLDGFSGIKSLDVIRELMK